MRTGATSIETGAARLIGFKQRDFGTQLASLEGGGNACGPGAHYQKAHDCAPSKEITLLMPVGLPRIRSRACSGG